MTSSGHAYLQHSALCSMPWREHAACAEEEKSTGNQENLRSARHR